MAVVPVVSETSEPEDEVAGHVAPRRTITPEKFEAGFTQLSETQVSPGDAAKEVTLEIVLLLPEDDPPPPPPPLQPTRRRTADARINHLDENSIINYYLLLLYL